MLYLAIFGGVFIVVMFVAKFLEVAHSGAAPAPPPRSAWRRGVPAAGHHAGGIHD